MKDAPDFPAAFIRKDGDGVVISLPCVDDDRLVQRAGKAKLRAKDGLLYVVWRKVVVIVEADLTNGADRRRGGDLVADDDRGALRIVRELMRLMGMDTDCDADFRPQGIELSSLRRLVEVPAFEDYQSSLDARLASTIDDSVEVGSEAFVGKMAVTVDHARRSYSARSASTGSTLTTRRAGT